MKEQIPSTAVPDRGKQVEEDLWQRYKAERGIWSEPMLVALERGIKGNKWFSLIDKVWSERTLELAWQKVQSNAGACGVDGITIRRFAKDSQSRLLAVNERLKRGTYQPKPVKRVWIDKAGSSEKRPLGIPTVTDRVVQAAVKMVIEPIFEREFAEHSYGFRPGRSGKDALRRVEELLKGGSVHVVDVDIKGYFDNINHDGLMKLIRERISDGRVLGLLEGFLKQGVIEGTGWEQAKGKGTPQGGVISPLLANIYLNPLDHLMSGLGLEMVRYADDMVVLCRDHEEAQRALSEISKWMDAVGLTLHPEKTRLVDLSEANSHFDFLGYRFKRSGRSGRLMRLISPKSEKRFRAVLRQDTKRSNGRSIEETVKRLNRRLRGWYGYFKHAEASAHSKMDGWVRMRLRSILRKRRKGRGRGRGLDHHRWPNCYFAGLGLYGLLDAYRTESTNLRKGVKC